MRHLPIYFLLALAVIPIGVLLIIPFARYIPLDNPIVLVSISFASTVIATVIVCYLLKARFNFKQK